MNKKRMSSIISLFIICSLIAFIFMYLRSPYTFVEENKIINYAIQGMHGKFKVDRVYVDDDYVSYRLDVNPGAKSDQYGMICKRMNEYLESYPDYFLNRGYNFELSFCSPGPEGVRFTDMYTYEANNKIKLDGLYCMEVDASNSWNGGFDLKEIRKSKAFSDVQYLIINKEVSIKDLSVLSNFTSLSYLFIYNFTEEQMNELKLMIPDDCQIKNWIEER